MYSIILLTEPPKELKVSEVGGKGYSLGVLAQEGFDIPNGFIILSDVFFDFLRFNNIMEKVEKLSSEIDEKNFKEKSEEIKVLILKGKIPKKIALEVKEGLEKLNSQYVSVRSSAVSEDGIKDSFAGLFDTFLNIKAESFFILEYLKKCWTSLYNDRAIVYRIKKGGMPYLERMAVIIQEMIPADVSGITYTVHPINKEGLLIEASHGIGDLIVGGIIEPDDYIVQRQSLEVTESKIGKKTKMSIIEKGELKIIDVKKELAEMQILSNDKIIEIAKISLEIEKIFNHSQEIEWCILNNKLWILQSRAITTTNYSKKRTIEEKFTLKGTPASSGILRGKVIIVEDKDEIENLNINSSTILVIKSTNPSYTLLILAAGAVVVESGSIGAHVAQICREVGKPCIVQVENAYDVMSNWNSAYIDGSSGLISKIEGENES